MGSGEGERRRTKGWAARDPSGILSPYTFTLRNTGPEDVFIKVICCGICHTDLHQLNNDFGTSTYPMVPGHEVVDEVVEVGSGVIRFTVGDTVGAGYVVGSGGGYRACRFFVKISEEMPLEQAAPLSCIVVTAYSLLKHLGLKQSSLRGGIMGLGGGGHLAVKIAKAIGLLTIWLSPSSIPHRSLCGLGG